MASVMNDTVISFLLGVLEDYSNRYIGFGALFATSLLGIYTVIGFNKKSISKIVKLLIVIPLFISGLFSIAFTYRYTRLTSGITSYILNSSDSTFRASVQEAWNKSVIQNDPIIFRNFTLFVYKNLSGVFILIGIIYTLITWVPFLSSIDFLFNEISNQPSDKQSVIHTKRKNWFMSVFNKNKERLTQKDLEKMLDYGLDIQTKFILWRLGVVIPFGGLTYQLIIILQEIKSPLLGLLGQIMLFIIWIYLTIDYYMFVKRYDVMEIFNDFLDLRKKVEEQQSSIE